MVRVEEMLADTLENLGREELKKFKWKLQVGDGFTPIRKCRLDGADYLETVNVMVQTHNQQAVEVAQKILSKMGRLDLVEKLSKRCSEPQGKP